MIKVLERNNFRQFSNKKLYLGNRITVIAGRNSTGKSTILGLLGNAGELKKRDGQPFIRDQFRTEFSEIFKGSLTFDPSGPRKCRVIRDSNGVIDYRDFRVAWQNEGPKGTRFRIFPERKDSEHRTNAKMKFPVLYLGLSRLYPIGEATDSSIQTSVCSFPSVAYKEWFIKSFADILSLHDDVEEVSNSKIGETANKQAVGITTKNYDYLANSAGQDNIGQILLAILSFRYVHETHPEYNDGILLIDELDATLHPAAQNKLFKVLFDTAKAYGFQVVFTTHSTSLLKYVCSKIDHNKNEDDFHNDIELYYFTNANRTLELKRNPDIQFIENDLLLQTAINQKIKVYAEDDEARWLIERLLSGTAFNIELVKSKIGCEELLRLINCDPRYFQSVIIVLDGDVKDENDNIQSKKLEIIQKPLRDNIKSIVTLPSQKRMETMFFEYMCSLSGVHPFWEAASCMDITYDSIRENGPDSEQYRQAVAERERAKKWFIDFQSAFESIDLFEFWKADNLAEATKFQQSFCTAYNIVADKLGMRRVTL